MRPPFEVLEERLHALCVRLAGKPRVAAFFHDAELTATARGLRRQERRAPVLVVAATWTFMVGICAFFYVHVSSYIDWPPAAYSSPKVANLTDMGVKWRVTYGTRDQPEAVLPVHQFPLSDYKHGELIRYSTTFDMPLALLNAKEDLVFHSVYVWAKHYDFFVNGERVDSGGPGLMSITLPRHLLAQGPRLSLALVVDPGDLVYQGMAHHGALVIGPKSLLEPLRYTARELRTSYVLWFMLPRMTLSLLFCFLFLSMTKNRENILLFAFIMTSCIKLYFSSDFIDSLPLIGDPQKACGAVDLIESFIFLAFIERYFRRDSRTFNRVMVGLGVAVNAVLLSGALVTGTVEGFCKVMTYVQRALHIGGVGYALYLAAGTSLYLAYSRKSRPRLQASLLLLGFLAISMAMLLLEALHVLNPATAPTIMYSHELALCIVLAGLVSLEFGSTVTQRDQIKSRFRTVVDARVADRLLERPETLAGQSLEATILFSDIRSFTTLSERLAPAELVEMLNSYFEIMVRVIRAHGGVVDKFIGDAIMAVWGVPAGLPIDPEMAVRCAVEMRRRLAEFNRFRKAQGAPPIAIGIGLHSGTVIAGGVGASQRLDYTVIGDTVNIASRIEAQTKDFGTDIVVSGATWERVKHAAVAAHAGIVRLRGKTVELEILRLIGVFEENGEFACHDPVYEAAVHPTAPGLVVCTARNLVTYDYSTDVPDSRAA